MIARNHDIIEEKENFHPWETIISEINSILRELHTAIADAFLNNKWAAIAQHEHAIFEKNIEQIILDYCQSKHLSKETITPAATNDKLSK